MEYNGTVYRPPMEADTFLIPVTEGCCAHSSNMDMTFLNPVLPWKFRGHPLFPIHSQVDSASRYRHIVSDPLF